MFYIQLVGLRAGQALVWVMEPKGSVTLHRVERHGSRLFSRVALWGNPEKWPEGAAKDGCAFFDGCDARKGNVPVKGVEDLLAEILNPPASGRWGTLFGCPAPIIKGKASCLSLDVDLTVTGPRR